MDCGHLVEIPVAARYTELDKASKERWCCGTKLVNPGYCALYKCGERHELAVVVRRQLFETDLQAAQAGIKKYPSLSGFISSARERRRV